MSGITPNEASGNVRNTFSNAFPTCSALLNFSPSKSVPPKPQYTPSSYETITALNIMSIESICKKNWKTLSDFDFNLIVAISKVTIIKKCQNAYFSYKFILRKINKMQPKMYAYIPAHISPFLLYYLWSCVFSSFFEL